MKISFENLLIGRQSDAFQEKIKDHCPADQFDQSGKKNAELKVHMTPFFKVVKVKEGQVSKMITNIS